MKITYQIDRVGSIYDFLVTKGYYDKALRTVKRGTVLVNGEQKRLWEKVVENDLLELILPEEKSTIQSSKGEIEIVYEDDYLLVVNKPPKMASMPNAGYYECSLANYVKGYFEEQNICATVHLVNRLDCQTHGLVLIAKHQLIHGFLSKTKITKRYYAVVEGVVECGGDIWQPIIDDGNKRIIGGNKMAWTNYKVIRHQKNTLLDILLQSGRTHQIRVHMQYLGHPVCGDNLYGHGSDLALESYYLQFIHPITNEELEFNLPITDRLLDYIERSEYDGSRKKL